MAPCRLKMPPHSWNKAKKGPLFEKLPQRCYPAVLMRRSPIGSAGIRAGRLEAQCPPGLALYAGLGEFHSAARFLAQPWRARPP